jgi:hypothetical protein
MSSAARDRLHGLRVGFYREREEGGHRGERESRRPVLMALVSPSMERE